MLWTIVARGCRWSEEHFMTSSLLWLAAIGPLLLACVGLLSSKTFDSRPDIIARLAVSASAFSLAAAMLTNSCRRHLPHDRYRPGRHSRHRVRSLCRCAERGSLLPGLLHWDRRYSLQPQLPRRRSQPSALYPVVVPNACSDPDGDCLRQHAAIRVGLDSHQPVPEPLAGFLRGTAGSGPCRAQEVHREPYR